jgi:hypothetical protein
MIALLPQHFLILNQNAFFKYTLTNGDKFIALFWSLINLSVYSLIGLYFFRNNPKRLSGVIGLVVASTTVIDAAIYLFMKFPYYRDYFLFGKYSIDILQSNDDFAVYSCLSFGVGLLWDVLFGLIFYRDKQDFVNVYMHHSILIWTAWAAVTNHGLVYAPIDDFAAGFTYMAVEDITSWIMALGIVFPYLRSDWAFGLSFFFFRILFHNYMFVYALFVGINWTNIVLFALATIMQLYWMQLWYRKYALKLGLYVPEKWSLAEKSRKDEKSK